MMQGERGEIGFPHTATSDVWQLADAGSESHDWDRRDVREFTTVSMVTG